MDSIAAAGSSATNVDPAAQAVLEFWFGDALSLGWPSESRKDLWFGGGAELDQRITQNFGPLVTASLAGDLQLWQKTPLERLALVVLLDQFTRNAFRGEPQAFSGDGVAQALVTDAMAREWDTQLPLAGRVFLAMPWMHAESLELQLRCVGYFDLLCATAGPEHRAAIRGHLEAAEEHRDIVVRFGRFPHRNKALGRASTPEELSYLANGKNFGQ
ncbi:MAG: DUF924 domain-containing protein [Rhodoferax sp.]|nr:DUF924 domain-containing protein [Rhodoferax sp.]